MFLDKNLNKTKTNKSNTFTNENKNQQESIKKAPTPHSQRTTPLSLPNRSPLVQQVNQEMKVNQNGMIQNKLQQVFNSSTFFLDFFKTCFRPLDYYDKPFELLFKCLWLCYY